MRGWNEFETQYKIMTKMKKTRKEGNSRFMKFLLITYDCCYLRKISSFIGSLSWDSSPTYSIFSYLDDSLYLNVNLL